MNKAKLVKPTKRAGTPGLNVFQKPVMEFEHVSFAFGRQEVLRDVSLRLETNEFACLVGQSGCGKTTALRIAAGLLKLKSGRVLIEGEALVGPSEKSAMVFQSDNLFVWRTALDNVAFALEARGMPKRRAREAANRSLRLVGLSDVVEKKPRQLSGGMRQRVNLARALVGEPKVILMDEPFSALDYQTRALLQLELDRIFSSAERSVLFVTHDVREAVFLASRIHVMTAAARGVVKTFEVSWPRPRDPDIRLGSEFQELVGTIEHAITNG
jgi:NitT/TauT family transport system ATP-binding protein